jgi:hypothetical protein
LQQAAIAIGTVRLPAANSGAGTSQRRAEKLARLSELINTFAPTPLKEI